MRVCACAGVLRACWRFQLTLVPFSLFALALSLDYYPLVFFIFALALVASWLDLIQIDIILPQFNHHSRQKKGISFEKSS